MPVAIEFFLDDASANVVRQVWRDIAESGISPYLSASGVRPHLTVAVGERVDEPAVESLLRRFAANTAPRAVAFAGLGVSPGEHANLYLTAVVTADLLDLHAGFYGEVEGLLEASSERYRPGRWVPHCTLVEHVPADLVPRAVEISRRAPLPLEARLVEIGAVTWRPVRQICAFPLARQP